MAHFAELDENNIVVNVFVINNSDVVDENNVEQELIGINFCKSLYGQDKTFIQTSYNHRIRHKYACVGDKYDENYDAFITPPLHPSYIFNEPELTWEPPLPYPNDPNPDNLYYWDEPTIRWKLYPN